MKNFILYIFICGGLLSCDLHGKQKMSTQFELENGTAHDIKIESYHTFDKKLKKTILLSNKGSVWTSKVWETLEPVLGFDNMYEVFEGDSIRIVFNKKKVLIYINEFENKSILYDLNYTTSMVDEHFQLRRYSFSDEDYESAVDF
jgi:hypothetical protein